LPEIMIIPCRYFQKTGSDKIGQILPRVPEKSSMPDNASSTFVTRIDEMGNSQQTWKTEGESIK